jgi:hypothetical protein
MENYLEDYNVSSKAPMDLVLFRFAIEHISRVCRVLRQPNGHALLVGMLAYSIDIVNFTKAHVVRNICLETNPMFGGSVLLMNVQNMNGFIMPMMNKIYYSYSACVH